MKSAYTHYSFDLWLTLIKSDPRFKEARADYFFRHFNTRKKSKEEVALVFRQVDGMCNAINEKTGRNIDAEEMYLMVISILNDHLIPIADIDVQRIYDEMEVLVFQHHPVVYSEDTKKVLDRLKCTQDTTLNILSNTGFIKGRTVRKVLDTLEMSSYFDFQLYSDETGFSKPNTFFFQYLLQKISDLRENAVSVEDIIHVGDNPVADVEGARSVGIHSLLINSNQQTITNLITLC